jgi:CBS-domain-containing membrane protein
MTQNAQCLDPESSLRAVAAKMKEIDCGAVPICHNDRLVGMVTDRDMVTKALAEGRDPNSTRARDVMTSPIVYCFEDQDIGEAARVMEVRQIRRLVVLNKDKRLVGIVSLGDLSCWKKSLSRGIRSPEKGGSHGKPTKSSGTVAVQHAGYGHDARSRLDVSPRSYAWSRTESPSAGKRSEGAAPDDEPRPQSCTPSAKPLERYGGPASPGPYP